MTNKNQIVVPSQTEGAVGSHLPFMKIPNGCPPDDEIRTLLTRENEPDLSTLQDFFSNEKALERLAYCPQMNRDPTDDWGQFGYEPGFFFICKQEYAGEKTINDHLMRGEALPTTEIIPPGNPESEYSIPVFEHNDFFPRSKYSWQRALFWDTPRTFLYLATLMINPPHSLKTSPEKALANYEARNN